MRERLARIKKKAEITKLYLEIANYENGWILVEKKTWYALVEKTIALTGSVSLLTNLLRTKLYPHTDFYSHNSPYLHYAVAAAINSPVSQSEITNYISQESGHQGFLAMIKAHAENNRRDEGKRYFKTFLQFCDFLVN